MKTPKHPTTRKAAALRYRREKDPSPRLVAKGRGKVADRIVSLAQKHDIPLVEDPNLAQMLEALDIDVEIPPEMYRAVAEVLVFVYRLNREAV